MDTRKRRKLEFDVEKVTGNKRLKTYTVETKDRLFSSYFGVTFDQLLLLANMIHELKNKDKSWQTKHLLWTLIYLKQYPTIDEFTVRLGKSKNTIKKWLYITLDIIGDLPLVSNFYCSNNSTLQTHHNLQPYRLSLKTGMRVKHQIRLFLYHMMVQIFPLWRLDPGHPKGILISLMDQELDMTLACVAEQERLYIMEVGLWLD